MAWWLWLVLGLCLLVLELATPGSLFFMFFGVAALLVGVLAGAWLESDVLQVLVFAVLSVGSLLVFRGPLLRRMKSGQKREVDAIAGQTALLTDDLPARGQGKAELRGTVWSVENASDLGLPKGQRVRVERVDGLKLIVRPE